MNNEVMQMMYLFLLSILEEFENMVTSDDTSGDAQV